MVSKRPRAYTFSAIYIGDAAPATGQLVKIPNISTNPVVISDKAPTQFLSWLNINVLTGEREVAVSVEYYDAASFDLVDKIATNLSVDGTFGDVSELQLYSLFLLAPEGDTYQDSWYFPIMRAEFDFTNQHGKESPISTTLNFSRTLNDLGTIPYYRDTTDEIVNIMSTRSPL